MARLQHHRRSAADGDELRRAAPDRRERNLPVARGADAGDFQQVAEYRSLGEVPAASVGNTRNDMYLARGDPQPDEGQGKPSSPRRRRRAQQLRASLDDATKFIPSWVKLAVAIALGLGTMVGLEAHRRHRRREDRQDPPDLRAGRGGRARGRRHDHRGRPLRPAGDHHPRALVGRRRHHGGERLGLQMSTVRNIALAWVLTLPASMMLSAVLYWVFSQVF